MKKIVIVLGPTAVGKSDIGVKLAERFNGEIISADSVQIYRGLDIGSAKITDKEMNGVPHHGINILPPTSEFSVFDFVEYTRDRIDEILNRGRLPIIVGGTGLYIRALLGGYTFGNTQKNEGYRAELESKNVDELYSMLLKVNPDIEIDKHNKKRLIRKLEIAKFGDEPKSKISDYNAFIINLSMDRKKLYERINSRVDIMLNSGLLNEVKDLINRGVKKDSQSMRAIGYKEVISYLEGEYDYNRMVELIKQHSRNYAKRQMTFFRSMTETRIYEIERTNISDIISDIERWKNDNQGV